MVPNEPDADGKVLMAAGIAIQAEKRMNVELNKDKGFLKRTFSPDQVGAFVMAGVGSAITADIAIPGDKAEQVIALVNSIKQTDPNAFDEIIPQRMRLKNNEPAAKSVEGIEIPAADQQLLKEMKMAPANQSARAPSQTQAAQTNEPSAARPR